MRAAIASTKLWLKDLAELYFRDHFRSESKLRLGRVGQA
jgi:hypothetical protein